MAEAPAAADAPEAGHHRRRYLVDRRFQLKYALLMAGAGLAVALVFGLWLHQAHVQATALLASDPETRALVEPQAEHERNGQPSARHEERVLELEPTVDEVPAPVMPGLRRVGSGGCLGHAMLPSRPGVAGDRRFYRLALAPQRRGRTGGDDASPTPTRVHL